MEERQDRHIPHNMPDYESFIAQLKLSSSQVSLPAGTGDASITFDSSSSHHKLKEETKDWILQNVALVMSKIPQGGQYSPTSLKGKEKQDSSIYVGTGGNAYLHWKLTRFFQAEGEKEKADFHRQSAVSAINVSLGLLPRKVAMGRGISFYIGSAGIHALATAIFWASGHLTRTEEHLRELLSFLPSCLSQEAPDEILFGRAGYLFCLQFVQTHVSKELCERLQVQAAARQVFDALMESGKRNSGCKPPKTGVLTYFYYGKSYHGAAHGTSGILYMLLQFPSWCQDPANLPWVTATVDSILNSQFPSGNFPSKFPGSGGEDKLVHWCHGAPGVVYTLYHAHKVLGGDKSILRSLDRALATVWERGVLRKGVGVCHGTCGSGYCFLMMYRYTGAEEYLYRAHKMAEAIRSEQVQREMGVYFDPQRHTTGVPDFPYSLMEGIGGAICYCCDLLHPDSAAFPGYEGDIIMTQQD